MLQRCGQTADYQLKLNRDTSIVPVAQKARRLPFTLRTAVQEKVKDLIAQDIIEPVEGPTTWCSPIDNLQNYCLGSSRGKSRLLRWLSRWLHSHLHGEND